MAENYHNIWAKKKKSELGSRGDLHMKSVIGTYYTQIPVKQRGRDVWVDVKCHWLVVVLICASEHMCVSCLPVFD